MFKLLPVVVIASLLGGCTDHEGVGELPPEQAQPQINAPADHSQHEVMSERSANEDPESRNGIAKTPLNGRAFTIDDFGSAPDGNAYDVIRGLEPDARAGNGKASYEIYLKIAQCMPPVGQDDGTRSSFDAKSENECRDLPPEYLAARSDWLRLAADQGHLGAQLVFAADPQQVIGGLPEIFKDPEAVVGYKRQAIEYLESAANRGSVDALLQLGNAYQVGVMASQDNVTSYAYYLAAERAAPGTTSSARLQMLRDGLSTSQLQESHRKSKELYDECCASN